MKITIKRKLPVKETYSIGQVIEITSGSSKGNVFLLAMTAPLRVNLIDLSTGNRFTEEVHVDNGQEITRLEMSKIVGTFSFKVVEAELIIT